MASKRDIQFHLIIPVTAEYLQTCKNYFTQQNARNLFDFSKHPQKSLSVSLRTKDISLRCGNERKIIPYKKIRRCTEQADGLVITTKDGEGLYLPVSTDEDQNCNLTDSAVLLQEKCLFRYRRAASLTFPEEEEDVAEWNSRSRKEKRKYNKLLRSFVWTQTALIILGAFGLVMSGIFINMRYTSLPLQNLSSVQITYASCQISHYKYHTNGIRIFSESGQTYDVYGWCASSAVQDQLQALDPGASLVLTLDQDALIVGIATEETEILSVEQAEHIIHSETTGFFWLGVILAPVACGCIGFGIRNTMREYREYQKDKLRVF